MGLSRLVTGLLQEADRRAARNGHASTSPDLMEGTMSTATATSPATPTSSVPRSAGLGRVVATLRRAATRRPSADARQPRGQRQLTDDYIDRYGATELDPRTVMGFFGR